MKLLAIESAFEPCSVALWLDGDCRERFESGTQAHARKVLPFVEDLLAEAGLPLSTLDAIAFSRGPGSFTSLRIGISAVQGLAWGADLPVAPVSSLQTTAQSVVGLGVRRGVVAMDARMEQVYCGRFELDGLLMRAVDEERVCDPADVLPGVGPGWSGVGNGFDRYPELAGAVQTLQSVHADAWPRAADVARLAADWLQDHRGLRADEAQPIYLRDKVAYSSR